MGGWVLIFYFMNIKHMQRKPNHKDNWNAKEMSKGQKPKGIHISLRDTRVEKYLRTFL